MTESEKLRELEVRTSKLLAVVSAAEKMRRDYQEDMDAWSYAEYDGSTNPCAPEFDAALAALEEHTSGERG